VAARTTPYARAMNELEEGAELRLDFRKLSKIAAAGCDVVPVAVQHADTGEVILVAYANDEALRAAIARRTAIFWSTSRNALWVKGETSGETFELIEVRVNCEQNSLLYIVRPRRGGIRALPRRLAPLHRERATEPPRRFQPAHRGVGHLTHALRRKCHRHAGSRALK